MKASEVPVAPLGSLPYMLLSQKQLSVCPMSFRPGVTAEEAKSLEASADPCAQFAGALISAFVERIGSPVTLGDYGAVASVIAPELITTQFFDVVVDTSAGPARGQTIVDRRPPLELEIEPMRLESGAHVEVTLDLDVEGMRNLWLTTIDQHWK